MFLTWDQLRHIPEYTRTLPTALTVGKMWRSKMPDSSWVLGFVGEKEGARVEILCLAVVLLEGPTHHATEYLFRETDWANYQRFLLERRGY